MKIPWHKRVSRDLKNADDMKDKHIALSEYDFVYTTQEMTDLVKLWNDGEGMEGLCYEMTRPAPEIFVLLIEAAEMGLLEKRKICFFDGSVCKK